ncbi:hypothetical protein [Coleofasciculus sp.]|uniref:hypothetical protein n=1 Tax=Coleofasciculus sp. TaxID=3100458 RepID=UPI003A225969
MPLSNAIRQRTAVGHLEWITCPINLSYKKEGNFHLANRRKFLSRLRGDVQVSECLEPEVERFETSNPVLGAGNADASWVKLERWNA